MISKCSGRFQSDELENGFERIDPPLEDIFVNFIVLMFREQRSFEWDCFFKYKSRNTTMRRTTANMCEIKNYMSDANISFCHARFLQGCYVVVTLFFIHL